MQSLLLEANFLLSGISNHSPSIVIVGDRPKCGPKPFQFFDMWTSHDDFKRVVKEVGIFMLLATLYS